MLFGTLLAKLSTLYLSHQNGQEIDEIVIKIFQSLLYNHQEKELTNSNLSSSNLELAVKKGITISKKASQFWVSSDYSDKQRLQYLIYPDGILYNKENNTLRTPRVNSLFTAISCLSYIPAENKNGQPTQIDQNSRWVVLTGLSSNFWEDVESLVNL